MNSFPAFLQAVLLYDRRNPLNLDDFIRQILGNLARTGDQYNILADSKPGVFYRLFGSNQLMVTVEYIDGRAQTSCFDMALSSPFTQIVTPDARDRIAAHRSHILVGVHHGSMPPQGQIGDLLRELGVASPGSTRADFELRLAMCWHVTKIANHLAEASLVHWTSSDHLLTGEAFAKMEGEPPSLLHIHPLLAPAGENAKGQALIEIKTHGVAHFLDREVHVLPCPVPWPEIVDAILAFVKLALRGNGYIIPDGDTFSPADDSVAYRVRHVAKGEKSGELDGPLYEFELLKSRALDFVASDYIPPNRVIDELRLPPDIARDLGAKKNDVVREWRAKRQMAEAAGNQLQVKARSEPGGGQGLLGALKRALPFRRR
jgi:hypothetical protein